LANIQLSQAPKPDAPTPTPKPDTQEEDEEFADEEGLNDEVTPKPIEEQQNSQNEAQEQAQRVMMLQDNGIFRAELLSQLNEIRKALSILASIGIDLTKTDDK